MFGLILATLMWKAIRYRRAQALVIAALSALITACAVFAPLYDRALQQSLVGARLAHDPVQVSGLRLTSSPSTDAPMASSPEQLGAQVRGRLRTAFLPPQPSVTLSADARSPKGVALSAEVLWRRGMCEHVRFTSGRCPTSAGQVAVSSVDAKSWHWRVGEQIPLTPPRSTTPTTQPPTNTSVRITGVFQQRRGDYWYGTSLTGWSGAQDPDSGSVRTDRILTARATTVTDWAHQNPTLDLSSQMDFPLRKDVVGIDRLMDLGPQVDALTARIAPEVSSPGLPTVTVYSGLSALAQEMRHERDQAAQIVPMLMVQLALLALVVLWLVLGAVVEQRRPEVALARLRGRGTSGARRLVLREVGAMVLVGVPAGAVLTLVLSWLARRYWLPVPAPFEWRLPAWVALLLAAVVLLGTAFMAVLRVSREPVASLLRRVPARRVGWRVGAADAVVVAVAIVAVVNVTSGSAQGPLALATPTLLAVAVGLVLAHLVVPVATVLGRSMLAHGHLGTGLSALQIARRPATRRAVAVLTVSTALLVFAANALVIGARNRSDSAQQVVGAARVVTVDRPALSEVRRVLDRLDPSGRELTPGVQVQPPGPEASTVEAVVPDQFRRIALFPGAPEAAAALPRLVPKTAPPRRVRGTSISAKVSTSGMVPSPGSPVELRLQLLTADNEMRTVILGNLPYRGSRATVLHALLPCRTGCTVTGLTLDMGIGASDLGGRFVLSKVRTSDQPHVWLGSASEWYPVDGSDGDGRMAAASAAPAGVLAVDYVAVAGPELTMTHRWVPSDLPALLAGAGPPDAQHGRFQAAGLDGIDRSMHRVGHVAFVPGAPKDTLLVDLDMLQRGGQEPATLDSLQVWFAHDDPALLARLTTDLGKHGISATESTTPSDQRRTYDESAAAIGLGLALVVGIGALLIAALVLLVLVATSWRLRTRDYAALRLAGVPRGRITALALGEQLPVVGLAVVVGAGCGVYGAHLAMPSVPLFSTPPAVSVLDLVTDWPAVLVSAAGAFVLLVGVGTLCGRLLSARSHLLRVREMP
jgi:hypothetical protein